MKKIIVSIVIITNIICNSVPIYSAATITANLVDSKGNPVSKLEFPGIASLTLSGNLWIVSPQHVYVTYSSTEASWGVRIITKNHTDISQVYPKPLDPGKDFKWAYENYTPPDTKYHYNSTTGKWETDYADPNKADVVTYAGMILAASKDHPYLRAPMAWQVFPTNPSQPMLVTPPTTCNNNTVGDKFDDDWVWLADAEDSGFIADPESEFFYVSMGSTIGPITIDLLAQHPVIYRDAANNPLPKPCDGKMEIYLAARFGWQRWNETKGKLEDFAVLPWGNYETQIYLEIVHW